MSERNFDAEKLAAIVTPSWFQDVSSGLAIRSQFAVSGNVRDVFPVPAIEDTDFVQFDAALWHVLQARGFVALLVHDLSDGLRLHAECDHHLQQDLETVGFRFGEVSSTPAEMAELVTRVMREHRLPMALVLDYASQGLIGDAAAREAMFVAVDKAARGPQLMRPGIDAAVPSRNPIFWVVERTGDLPEWFSARNPLLRAISIGMPDLSERTLFAECVAENFPDVPDMEPAARKAGIGRFAIRCEGMSLLEMYGVVELARTEQIPLAEFSEAIRTYRLGTVRNPWAGEGLRDRIRGAAAILKKRVMGQPQAIERTYDILVRSITGMSGAQASGTSTRPRGVLFFVGPSGVGKTELAKAISEVIFGDEAAMRRFDMSEFTNAESILRLVGAPPGGPGHEAGGELVNAVRARPFGVYLFDEIEKAHPRILDMFLQILDDGRLSDSRGETGYFSEALIIFTSNVGMVGGNKSTNGGQSVLPSDSPEVLEEKLLRGVGEYFRTQLGRPELMNRLGRNIVPFQFINAQSAASIFDALVRRVAGVVSELHGVRISLSEAAHATLLHQCTFELNDGGRGIANRIESSLVNPLSHILFHPDCPRHLVIEAVEEKRGTVELTIRDGARRGAAA